jgi:hypothetical protein
LARDAYQEKTCYTRQRRQEPVGTLNASFAWWLLQSQLASVGHHHCILLANVRCVKQHTMNKHLTNNERLQHRHLFPTKTSTTPNTIKCKAMQLTLQPHQLGIDEKELATNN